MSHEAALRLEGGIACQNDVDAVGQRTANRFIGFSPHQDGVTGGDVFEMLQVGWQVPGELVVFADHAVFRHGDDGGQDELWRVFHHIQPNELDRFLSIAVFVTIVNFMLVLTMKPITLPKYTEISQALSKTTLKLHPSQVHGLICGILTGNPKSTAAWEELITGGEESVKTHEELQKLYDVSSKQLDEFLFEFQLLLPPDSDDLPVRAEALTLWSQGYLTGLKLSQVQIINRQPSDVTEAINDIIEIAKMNFEDVVANEEDEAAYVELVEYVRMAAILIYQDLRESEAPKQASGSGHHLH